MGGRKESGLGRRHGREGLLKYTEPQTVAVQRLVPFAPPDQMPFDRWARVFTAALRVMKAVRPAVTSDAAARRLRRRRRRVRVRRRR